MKPSATGHLSGTNPPRKAKLDDDVPSLDGCGNHVVRGELIDPVPNLEEFPKELEL